MQLPGNKHADWQRLSPIAVVFFLLTTGRQIVMHALPGLIVLVVTFSSQDGLRMAWIGIAVAVGVGLLVALAFFSWARFRYAVSNDRILVRRGILHREELDIDFERVQNVNIQEHFYMRPFGLAVVAVDTAGSTGSEVQLAGIPLERAQRLRDTVLEHHQHQPVVQDLQAAATEQPDSAGSSSRVLHSMSTRDVVLAGLTANFMLWVAVAAGAFFSTGEMATGSLESVVESFRLDQAARDLVARESTPVLILMGLLVGLALLIILPLISILGAVFRYHGYTLTQQGETLRKSAGLLTRHDESLKKHKIQSIEWKQSALARLLGRLNLQLRQASAGVGADTAQAAGMPRRHLVIPAVEPALGESLTAEFLQGCDPSHIAWTGVNGRRFIAVPLFWIAMPITIGLSIPTVLVSPWFAAPLLLLWPLLFTGLYLSWRQAGYAVRAEYGFIRSGFIGRKTTVFPLFKIQRVDVVQTPPQRRRKLAHLTVHLASHSVTVPFVDVDDAHVFRDLAVYQAERSKRPWY